MLGMTIDGKYRIARLLGRGGMGAVYEAHHTGTGRRVALKVITSELGLAETAIVRFQREARAAGAIESQHIVQVLDTGVDQALGAPFIVMEFLVGEDLQQLKTRVGPLPQDVVLRIAGQACFGLQKAHEAGVVHRDVKPANLFLAQRDDGECVVRILDFGIAKVKIDQGLDGEDQGLTRTGSMLGSPMYMSPEQAMGLKTVDPRSDIWSLGAVMYEVLTGRTPHHGKDTLGQLIMAICSAPPPPIQSVAPWISPQVSALVHRAMRLDPSERFQSAMEMRDAIRALVPGAMTLTESALTSLTPTERQQVAPLDVQTASATLPAKFMVTAPDLPVANVPPPVGTADRSFSSTRRDTARSNGSRVLLPLGAVAIAVVIGAAALRSYRDKASPPRLATPTATVAASTTTAASAPLPVPASVSPPAVLTVRLQVSPPNSKVDIDGNATEVVDGFVQFEGPVGSVHTVHGTSGTRQATEQVSIGEAGAVPARLDLGAPVVAADTRPRQPTVQARPEPPAPSQSHPVISTPSKPAPKPARPSLDKSFE